jgi:6-pyruvoyltetrahydropterin/6-carboxytetrahydropterin synthase
MEDLEVTASREIRITRVVGFSAAHRYHVDAFSDEENQRVFGKCNRSHGHGHNYRLEVTVGGPVDPVTGMVMNLADLDRLLRDQVVDVLDHSFLNYDVDHFATVVPTCENIVLWLMGLLDAPLEEIGISLKRLRLYESDLLFAEVGQ